MVYVRDNSVESVAQNVSRNYLGSMTHVATVLTEGGYIDASDGSYHFFVTDRLGNVRAVPDDGPALRNV